MVDALGVCGDVVGCGGDVDPTLSRSLFLAAMDVLGEVVREPTRDPDFYQHPDVTQEQCVGDHQPGGGAWVAGAWCRVVSCRVTTSLHG